MRDRSGRGRVPSMFAAHFVSINSCLLDSLAVCLRVLDDCTWDLNLRGTYVSGRG